MRKLVVAFAAVLLLPLWPARATGLSLLDDQALSPRLHELTLSSPALGRTTKVRVLLPADYSASARRYPVLFLLHGAGDNQSTWTRNTDVEAATAGLPLIVVMPDGGANANAGWYSDWVNGPQWESYHIGELVPWVDTAYRTSVRGVAGLSMGGYGAMAYATRHPDLFVVAGSFSGAVDNADGGPAEAAGYSAAHDQFGTPTSAVWGDYQSNEITWRDHNPADLAANLSGRVAPWLVTGNGVPLPDDSPTNSPAEAVVYTENRIFSARTGIPFTDRGHGVHSWKYWQQDLHDFLPFAMSELEGKPRAVKSFHYRTAESTFSVYGWTFTVDRSAKEFLDVDVNPQWVAATGSGTVHAVSPDGSRCDLDLGPSHGADQYTTQARLDEAAAGGGYWHTARARR